MTSVPHLLERVLAARATSIAGRLALTCAYWWKAMTELLDFPTTIGLMNHFGLEPAVVFAVATIAVELAGSAMVVLGVATWLGAGMLAVFTLLATLIAHDFWNMQGAERFLNQNAFLEH